MNKKYAIGWIVGTAFGLAVGDMLYDKYLRPKGNKDGVVNLTDTDTQKK